MRSFAPRERLDGITAVIAGGTGAIGHATALRLATLGARIVLLSRHAHSPAAQQKLHALPGGEPVGQSVQVG